MAPFFDQLLLIYCSVIAQADTKKWYNKSNLRYPYLIFVPCALGVECTSGFDSSMMNSLQNAVPIALIMPRSPRCTMFLTCTIGTAAVYTVWTVSSARFAIENSARAAIPILIFIFVLQLRLERIGLYISR
ncbi:hypothetical protein F5X96DRAFT_417322 [Biscogniauxia mediterranea]|nr:hypothetical protein F5X96DRAFT_417322 [Biscogniauxia mediterranea]